VKTHDWRFLKNYFKRIQSPNINIYTCFDVKSKWLFTAIFAKSDSSMSWRDDMDIDYCRNLKLIYILLLFKKEYMSKIFQRIWYTTNRLNSSIRFRYVWYKNWKPLSFSIESIGAIAVFFFPWFSFSLDKKSQTRIWWSECFLQVLIKI
jgi:hypothetical protein